MARSKRPRKPGTVELNYPVVGRLLRSKAITDVVEDTANTIKAAADAATPGAFHTVRVFQGRDRVRAHVGTDNETAMYAELQRRTLTRAISAARRLR